MTATGSFDGIYVADQIRNGHVRSRQFLDIALLRREIGDLHVVAALGDQVAAGFADRSVRIVVDLATCDVRSLGIEQRRECPQHATLGLAPQTEENEIVAGQHRVHYLRDDRVLVAHDSGKDRSPCAKLGQQVVAHLILYATTLQTLFRERTLTQFAKRPRETHDGRTPKKLLLLPIIRRLLTTPWDRDRREIR